MTNLTLWGYGLQSPPKIHWNSDLTQRTKQTYERTINCVKTMRDRSEWFKTKSRVRHDIILSLSYHNNKWNLFRNIKRKNINILVYADDAMLIINTAKELEENLNQLNKIGNKFHLRFHLEITEKHRCELYKPEGKTIKRSWYIFIPRQCSN